MVFEAAPSPHLVPFDGSFTISKTPTTPPKEAPVKEARKKLLDELVEELSELQHKLFAHDRYAVLTLFQAIDAAGKDSTIRAVFSGVNPAGCEVYCFKQPSAMELDHDFLWRNWMHLPQRGRIGVFNRSYYEEVLVVRVHPQILASQKLPDANVTERLWEDRLESIRNAELHLARNGVVILKFFLHVSPDEQLNRFISRLEEPEKYWKFSESDVAERAHWEEYMTAYQAALNSTSRAWAPWYAVPADSKSYLRYAVAQILVENLRSLDLRYPAVTKERKKQLERIREELERSRKSL